jgi:AraC-like DNA-binding protein
MSTIPEPAPRSRLSPIPPGYAQPRTHEAPARRQVANPGLHRRVDGLKFSRWAGGGSHLIGRPDSRDADVWPFVVVYLAAGSAVMSRRDVTAMLGPGDFVVVTNDASIRFERNDDALIMLIHVAAGAIGPYRARLAAADAQVWRGDRGTAVLVARLLDGLVAELEHLNPVYPGQLARHLVGFIAMACDEGARVSELHCDRMYDANVERAKEFIEINLGDLDLAPNHVARAMNVSIRTLHRAFERESVSVAGWIRWRRLEHCRAELADRARDHEAVGSIGARWGFWDAAHFSKLFKSHFGVSPRAYRSQTQHELVEVAGAATA